MFFLRNAWLIPAIPVVSFWIILLVGKRLPKKGSEVGIAALGLAFILSVATAGAWIARDARPAAEVPRAHAAAEAVAPTEGGEGAGGSHELASEEHEPEEL